MELRDRSIGEQNLHTLMGYAGYRLIDHGGSVIGIGFHG
jgi:hypothetical protein